MHLHCTSGNLNHLAQTLQSELVATKSFPSFFEEETSKTPSVIQKKGQGTNNKVRKKLHYW